MDKKLTFKELMEKWEAKIGSDWNHPRARIYIAATLDQYEMDLKAVNEVLTYERATNTRVMEFAKSLIVETLREVRKDSERKA